MPENKLIDRIIKENASRMKFVSLLFLAFSILSLSMYVFQVDFWVNYQQSLYFYLDLALGIIALVSVVSFWVLKIKSLKFLNYLIHVILFLVLAWSAIITGLDMTVTGFTTFILIIISCTFFFYLELIWSITFYTISYGLIILTLILTGQFNEDIYTNIFIFLPIIIFSVLISRKNFENKYRSLSYEDKLEEEVTKRTKELSISEQKFKNIAENIPGVVLQYKLDKDGKDGLLYLSKNVENLFEISHKDALNDVSLMWNRFHPEDLDKLQKSIKKSAEKLSLWNVKFRLLMPDKRIKWVQAYGTPTKQENGSIIWDTIQIDITEQVNAEKQMSYLSAIIENTENICVIKGLDLKVIAANESFAKAAGKKSIDELIGKTDAEIFNIPAEKEPIKGYIRDEIKAQSLKKGEKIFREEFVIYPDKSKKTVLTTKFPVYDNNNVLLATANISVDITDLKKVQEELIIAKEKAEESNRLKSAFLSNISHEIRTPMNGIMGFTQLLLDEELDEDIMSYVNIINKSANRLLETIDSIIEISQVDSKEVSLKNIKFNLIRLLKQKYEFFEPEASHKKIKLIFDNAPEDNLEIISDKHKVNSIIDNLLKNALKYTEKGTVNFGIMKNENSVVFYVKDTGFGIEEKYIELIFERFTRIPQKAKVIEGNGLGLSIVQSYVDLLGGTIKVESELGVGSKFTVELPFNKEETNVK